MTGRIEWPEVTRALQELRRGAEAITRAASGREVTPEARRAVEAHREAMVRLADLVNRKAADAARSEAADAALDAALEAVAMEAATAGLVEATGRTRRP